MTTLGNKRNIKEYTNDDTAATPVLSVRLLSEQAIAPCRKTAGAAGFDLSALENVCLLPRTVTQIRTGLAIALPPDTYGRIAARSSLALRAISVMAGVVDMDYRGELICVLCNHTESVIRLPRGSRIAQLIVEKICIPKIEVCRTLPDTGRGRGGFGSSGCY